MPVYEANKHPCVAENENNNVTASSRCPFNEDALLKEFRNAVKDLGDIGQPELRRFLRGKDYDMKAGEEFIRKSMGWRKAMKLDESLNWKIDEKVAAQFPVYMDGYDRDGRAVVYLPAGRWELRKMLAEGWKTEIDRHIYKKLATWMRLFDRSYLGECIIIIDIAELNYWKIAHYETVQTILRVFKDFEQNFPERLKAAVVVNAPWTINVIFPLIKPLLSGKTLQKVQIFNSDKSEYLPVLRALLPEEGFPAQFSKYYLQNKDDLVGISEQ